MKRYPLTYTQCCLRDALHCIHETNRERKREREQVNCVTVRVPRITGSGRRGNKKRAQQIALG